MVQNIVLQSQLSQFNIKQKNWKGHELSHWHCMITSKILMIKKTYFPVKLSDKFEKLKPLHSIFQLLQQTSKTWKNIEKFIIFHILQHPKYKRSIFVLFMCCFPVSNHYILTVCVLNHCSSTAVFCTALLKMFVCACPCALNVLFPMQNFQCRKAER